ncbi:MAG: UDP-N-acetylglucosamine 1-carboxyvinyltransferase [Caldicoprobacterales bacterium]|nr:UDP-N-acetylglucosamine 1-carboxyvinyltransferase [Clostridiales bacterium]
MAKFVITGGKKLEGSVRVSGAKNSVLPILAAALLTTKEIILKDCPDLADIKKVIGILEAVGCKVKREGSTLIVDPSTITTWIIPDKFVKEIRSSIIFLGAMIARLGKAKVTYPGGCEIGQRPINLHLEGLKKLGIEVNDSYGYIECHAHSPVGAEIHLDYPSVGATENIILAATAAHGYTIIRNAAKEPEIGDLQNFINAIGGKVCGAGTSTIIVEGKRPMRGATHTIIPDRIVAGTYLTAAAITGGEVLIENVILDHIYPVVAKLRESGAIIKSVGSAVLIKGRDRPLPIYHTTTLPYPGFPTDMQAPLMSLLSVSSGTSVMVETIFENRFKHVPELIRMGANIRIDGKTAVIQGVDSLRGTTVTSHDLRGGAALVLAGLRAEGQTIVENTYHIERGYECLECKLRSLGAEIEKI